MTRIVVGLGNPGPEYEWTRHNVGFHVLDHLALHEGLLFQTARHLESSGVPPGESGSTPANADDGVPRYGGPRKFRFARHFDLDALLVKPETFMNLSGEVVGPLLRWLGAPPEDLLVVTDDLDLDLGRLRIRPHGGTGGQKGMRSITESLGTDRFPRLRVGIGRPRTDAARHVLERLEGPELEEMRVSIAEASEALLDWLQTGDLEGCMTRFHSRWNQGAG